MGELKFVVVQEATTKISLISFILKTHEISDELQQQH